MGVLLGRDLIRLENKILANIRGLSLHDTHLRHCRELRIQIL
jgi:hypothetical protein